jgi:hypothetical protein
MHLLQQVPGDPVIHVHDWLDDPANKDHLAREFLEHARRPAIDKDHAWLAQNRPTAMWRGKRYPVVGASRLGDVWLKDPDDQYLGAFYTHRVDIAELTEWQPASEPEKQA